MTITATMFQSTMEVKISEPNFQQDLDSFKARVPPQARYWVEDKKVWVIKWPRLFTNLPYIQQALEERCLQMDLF